MDQPSQSSASRNIVDLIANGKLATLFFFMLLGLLPGLLALNAPLLLGYDDNWVTTSNPIVIHGLPYFFTQIIKPFQSMSAKGFDEGHWSPLTFLSFAVEHRLFGGAGIGPESFTPFLSRIMTALLHGLSGWMVFRIGQRFVSRPGAPLLAGLIFIFHPTVCESICWIIERNNVMSAFLGLAALLAYSSGAVPDQRPPEPSWRATAAAVALLFCSLLSKASGAAWWPVLLTYDVLICGGQWTRRCVRAALLAVPVAVAVIAQMRCCHDQLLPGLGDPPFGPWIATAILIVRYLWLLVFPVGLSAFYHVSPHVSLFDWRLPVGIGAVALTCLWARRIGLPWPRIVFYFVWITAGVGTIVNPFVQTSFLMQERYAYPSLPGFALLVAELLAGTAERFKIQSQIRIAVGACIATALLAGAMSRSAIWQSDTELFLDAAKKQPESASAHAYLARHLVVNVLLGAQDPKARGQIMAFALDEHVAAMNCDDFDRILFPLNHSVTCAELLLLRDNERARDDEHARGILLKVLDPATPETLLENGVKVRAHRLLAKNALMKHPGDALEIVDDGLKKWAGDPDLQFTRVRVLMELGRKDEARAEAESIRNAPPEIAPMLANVLQALRAEGTLPK